VKKSVPRPRWVRRMRPMWSLLCARVRRNAWRCRILPTFCRKSRTPRLATPPQFGHGAVRILPGHAKNQFLNFSADPRSARGSPVPSTHRNLRATSLRYHARMVVGQGRIRYIAENPTPQSMADRRASPARRPRASAVPSTGPSESGFPQPDTHSEQQFWCHRPDDEGQDYVPIPLVTPPVCPPPIRRWRPKS